MLSVLFLFCFRADEMAELRGYERYVGAYILGEILALLLAGLIWHCLEKKELSVRKMCIAAAASVVLLGGTGLLYVGPQVLRGDPFYAYREAAIFIQSYTEPDSAVTVVYDTENGPYDHWYGSLQSVIYYELNDRDILWGENLYALSSANPEAEEKVLEQLKASDYVCIFHLREESGILLAAFNNGRIPEEGAVYQVSETAGKLALKKC